MMLSGSDPGLLGQTPGSEPAPKTFTPAELPETRIQRTEAGSQPRPSDVTT